MGRRVCASERSSNDICVCRVVGRSVPWLDLREDSPRGRAIGGAASFVSKAGRIQKFWAGWKDPRAQGESWCPTVRA